MENLVALELCRGSVAEKYFKQYVNEGKFEDVEMMMEVFKHKYYGSDIFDRLIKGADMKIKECDWHIKGINEFKKDFRQFENINKFKEESVLCLQDTFDRFINVDLVEYVNRNIDDFKQETSSTRSGGSRRTSKTATVSPLSTSSRAWM